MDRRTLLCLAVLFVPQVASAAGDAPLDRATLRGLKAVSVVVDRIDPQLADEGLTAESMQRQLEERLRKAGMTVDKDAAEFVGLRIIATRVKKGPYSVCLEIGLYQPVVLSRDRDIKTATQTWETGSLIIVASQFLNASTSATVDQLADRFVSAWRSVNPQ